MAPKLETHKEELLPSITEIWDKLAKLLENKEYRDTISQSLLSLLDFAKASQKKTISTWARDALKKMYDLVIK